MGKKYSLVTMDDFGRVMIPKTIRDNTASRKFYISVRKKEIMLKPAKTLEELYGTLPKIDVKEFKRKHDEESDHELASR